MESVPFYNLRYFVSSSSLRTDLMVRVSSNAPCTMVPSDNHIGLWLFVLCPNYARSSFIVACRAGRGIHALACLALGVRDTRHADFSHEILKKSLAVDTTIAANYGKGT